MLIMITILIQGFTRGIQKVANITLSIILIMQIIYFLVFNQSVNVFMIQEIFIVESI